MVTSMMNQEIYDEAKTALSRSVVSLDQVMKGLING